MFLPSAFKSVSGPRSPTNFEQWPTPIVGIEPIGGQKRTQMCGTPSVGREHDRRRIGCRSRPPRSTAPAPMRGTGQLITARLPEWCGEATLVDWVQDDAEPPSWAEAHRRLQGEGRRSPVSHP
jgi:hypothetical protein